MSQVRQARCSHHPGREAVARCLECKRYYCRECITEHDHRVICSSCLQKLVASQSKPKRKSGPVIRLVQVAVGLVLLWAFFYLIGSVMLQSADAFHEGEFMETGWWE